MPRRRSGAAHRLAIIDTHTAGEPTRVVVGGLPSLRGATVREQRDYFRNELDWLRQALLWEPRGHRDMFGALLVKPSDPAADLGGIFMDAGGYIDMCVHGSIGLVTAALESALLTPRRGRAVYKLETPAGIVPLRARLRNGRAEEVTVRNVPSFLWSADVPLRVPGVGDVTVDVVYAGNWFALVSARDLGIDLRQTPFRTVLDVGRAVLHASRLRIVPEGSPGSATNRIDLVEIYADAPETTGNGRHHHNVVVFGDGQYDRSPCGTGTSARMAAMHARGQLRLEEVFLSESMTGGIFRGVLKSVVTLGGRTAVIPEVTGTAWVTGIGEAIVDSRDPLSGGFLAALD